MLDVPALMLILVPDVLSTDSLYAATPFQCQSVGTIAHPLRTTCKKQHIVVAMLVFNYPSYSPDPEVPSEKNTAPLLLVPLRIVIPA